MPARSPTRWASRTSRSICRTGSATRSSTTSSPSTARGRTPNPCVRCNGLVRFDAMLALAERIGAEALVTGHYARIERRRRGPAARARRRRGEGPDLHARRPATRSCSSALRFPLGELTKPEVRALARAGGPAGRRQAREPGPLLPRRHEPRALPRAPRRARRASGRRRRQRAAACSAATRPPPLHRRPAPGPRRRRGRAALRDLDRRAPRTGRRRAARRARDARGRGRRRIYRDGARVDGVKLRYRSEPSRCRSPGPGSTALVIELDDDVHGVAPGQTACLMDGDRVVGHGTIAAAAS